MKRAIVWAVLLLLTVTAACNGTRRENKAVNLAEGDYLSTRYIEELRKTRSPFEAGKRGGIDLIIVQRQGTALQLMPIYNFHEGGQEMNINSHGTMARLSAPNGDPGMKLIFDVRGDKTFRYGEGDEPPRDYVFVKDANTFLSNAVLVGTYKDSRGAKYEFREDGSAAFPKHTFKFEIGLDHIGIPYDYYVEMGKTNTFWAFRRRNGKLEVFATSQVEGLDETANKSPQYTLRPVQ